MSGLLLSLLTALLASGTDVLRKRVLKEADSLLLAWGASLVLVSTLPLALLAGLEVTFSWPLLLFCLLSGALNAAGTVRYLQALQLSDLSLVSPLMSLSPALLLLTSPLLVGESPGARGVAGVLLLSLGAYTLQVKGTDRHWAEPLRRLWRDPGCRAALQVNLIWAVAANVDKLGLEVSSPLVWLYAMYLGILFWLTPLALWRMPRLGASFSSLLPSFVLLGGAAGMVSLVQLLALTRTLVPYVISIKRTSAVLNVFWGVLFFGEGGFRARLLGALLMCLGVVLIALD